VTTGAAGLMANSQDSRRGSGGNIVRRDGWGRTLLLFLLLATAAPLTAAAPPPGDELAELEIRVVTVEPGPAPLSRFGHTLIWIRDRGTGEERAFDFGQSGGGTFLLVSSLFQGTTRATAGEVEPGALLARYREEGRQVWAQRLALEPGEVQTLMDELRASRGEYAYDLWRSNCTTRVRDLLDRSTGGRVAASVAGKEGSGTFRELVTPFARADPALRLVMLVGLSGAADRPMSAWEELFFPSALRARLMEVTTGQEGERALVAEEELWIQGSAPSPPGGHGRGFLLALIPGLVLGGVVGGLGVGATTRSPTERLFSILAGAWLLTAGLVGLALLTLWAVAHLELVRGNQNLFQANPLALVAAIAAWGSHARPGVALPLFLVVAALAVLGPLMGALVALPHQENGPLLLFSLPVHLGVLVGAWGWARNRRDSAPSSAACQRHPVHSAP